MVNRKQPIANRKWFIDHGSWFIVNRQSGWSNQRGKALFDLISHISDLRLSALCLCPATVRSAVTSASAPLHLTKLSSFVIVFMQNKANFQKSQVNVRPLVIMNYERKSNWTFGENKPNSNPNKANLKRAKMNANAFSQKDYRKNDAFAVQKNKPNSNPISVKPKMNANVFSQGDYENEARLQTRRKQTQFKANQTQFQNPRSDSVFEFE